MGALGTTCRATLERERLGSESSKFKPFTTFKRTKKSCRFFSRQTDFVHLPELQSKNEFQMKTHFLSVSLMFVLQWFIVGAAAAKTINVAYPSPSWNTSLPVSMAKEFGLFAAERLEVQPVYVRGGPVVMAALLGGDADFAVIAGVTAVASIQRGADIVIVAGHTAYIDQVLIGAKGITLLSDLKGKVVGVTGSGGVTEFATVEALARKGLLRDKDYTILYSGNSPARVNALENGLVQAAAFSAIEKVVMEQKAIPLLETGKAIPEFPFMVIVTSRKNQSESLEVIAFCGRAK
jgi:ABC-type nitrate/sulfonate/bicarbonate transport system substrate-binding protein